MTPEPPPQAAPEQPEATPEQIEQVVELLAAARRIAVLTGAGASTESGIPDFRSPSGLWQRQLPTTYQEFTGSADARKRYWELRVPISKQIFEAIPNATHHALVELERLGLLTGIITQNIDGLHQAAGSSPDRVIELHGTAHQAACTRCNTRSPIAPLLERVAAGDSDPRCPCGGYLKAATILFGQALPRAALEQAIALAITCDLFIVIGSSLRVQPAAHLPELAVERGAPLIILNREPTPLDSQAAIVLSATSGPTMRQVMTRLREWLAQ